MSISFSIVNWFKLGTACYCTSFCGAVCVRVSDKVKGTGKSFAIDPAGFINHSLTAVSQLSCKDIHLWLDLIDCTAVIKLAADVGQWGTITAKLKARPSSGEFGSGPAASVFETLGGHDREGFTVSCVAYADPWYRGVSFKEFASGVESILHIVWAACWFRKVEGIWGHVQSFRQVVMLERERFMSKECWMWFVYYALAEPLRHTYYSMLAALHVVHALWLILGGSGMHCEPRQTQRRAPIVQGKRLES